MFNFCQFDYDVCWCVPPWVFPAWVSLGFLGLADYFLSHVQGVFSYYLFKYFLRSFLSSSPGTPIMGMLVHLMLPQTSLRLSSFHPFYIFCSVAMISTILSSRSFTPASVSLILLWISFTVLFISVCLFFSSCGSLVNIFTPSQSLPPFFFWDPESNSLSLFWNLFLEGRLSPLQLFFWVFILFLHLGCSFLLFHAD